MNIPTALDFEDVDEGPDEDFVYVDEDGDFEVTFTH